MNLFGSDNLPPDADCDNIPRRNCSDCNRSFQPDDDSEWYCQRCEDRADRAMEDREQERIWAWEAKQDKLK